MRKLVILSLLAWAFPLSACATHHENPWKTEPWISVYFKYPFNANGAPYLRAGKVGPGFEIRTDQNRGSIGYIMLFPNGGEPRKRYLQNDGFSRFVKDWDDIGLMGFSQRKFDDGELQVSRNGEEMVQLAPFDDRTLIVTARQGDQVATLSIYAPDYFADAHGERPEGRALRAALDLFARVIGESIL